MTEIGEKSEKVIFESVKLVSRKVLFQKSEVGNHRRVVKNSTFFFCEEEALDWEELVQMSAIHLPRQISVPLEEFMPVIEQR